MENSGAFPYRILSIIDCLPYPPVSGGRKVSYATLLDLCEGGSLDVVCFDNDSTLQDVEALRKECANLGQVIRIPFRRRSRWTLPLLNLTGRSYFVYRDQSVAFREAVMSMLERNQYDYIFVDSFRAAINVWEALEATDSKVPVIGQFMNVNYVLTGRYLNRAFWLWPFLWLEYWLTRKKEIAWWKRVDRAVFISEADIEIARKAAGQVTEWVHSFPSGVVNDVPQCDPYQAGKTVLHVGTGSWLPNVDGLRWFIQRVWPSVKQRVPEAVFLAPGGGMPETLKRLESPPHIQMPGFVPDLDTVFRECAVFVAPLRFGSGIKIKVLDALARGVPVVATPIAMEGIPFRDEDHGVIQAGTPSEFAAAVVHLLEDRGRRRRLGIQARRAIQSLGGDSRLEQLIGQAREDH